MTTWNAGALAPAFGIALGIALGSAVAVAPGRAQDAGAHHQGGEGKRVYQRANCVGCHKWHGDGGGGYGGSALSLRATQLDREQIIEVVRCGRPGTGMPYHLRGAYDGDGCYGAKRDDLGKDVPVEAAGFLRPPEVEAVADYVLAAIKGHGEPGYADCAAFFGDGARVCNTYRTAQPAAKEPGGGG
jgi:mono/diheme cytochrome c family protein